LRPLVEVLPKSRQLAHALHPAQQRLRLDAPWLGGARVVQVVEDVEVGVGGGVAAEEVAVATSSSSGGVSAAVQLQLSLELP
tara:strand:- start:510 stop:755 length:246 start_codon:yes stop_codon:yes gene_type:complete